MPRTYMRQGDCLELMQALPDKSVDMILCDLPYGTTQNKWDTVIPFDQLWEQYDRVAKTDAAVVLMAAQPFTSALVMSNPSGFKYQWVWEKTAATGFLNAKKQPLRAHEDVLVFYKAQPTYNPVMRDGATIKRVNASVADHGPNYAKAKSIRAPYESTQRFPRSVLKLPKDNRLKRQHPTQKPVALMEYLIRTYTQEGDVVMDNCMGSGTTGVACMNLGRHFIGFEKDETYFETAKARVLAVKNELGLPNA